jgi:hypothetical protein
MLPHANVTTVPFHFTTAEENRQVITGVPGPLVLEANGRCRDVRIGTAGGVATPVGQGALPIGEVRLRQSVRVEGQVRSMRVRPMGDVPTLECILADATGSIRLGFLGRRSIAGINVGTRMRIEGRVGESRGTLAVLNPEYELLA